MTVHSDDDHSSAAEILAEETGRPVDDFKYDGPIPDARDQEFIFVDEPEDVPTNEYQRGQSALEIRAEDRRGQWIASDSPVIPEDWR